jgi:glycosyltransferase involved in cell wall biosynthesis
MPLVSILIPCYQERDFIAPCLESVRKFDLPSGWTTEVFVIDGGSTDGTPDLVGRAVAQDKRFQLLHNPRRIQSCALNIGITRSRGDYVLRLDAHSEYPGDYLARLIETATRTGADNVGGRIRTRTRGTGYRAALVQALTTHPFGVGSSFRTAAPEGLADTVPYGFFRRDTFERFGLFDERLLRAQDYEFNKRIVTRGGRIWLNPGIILEYFQQPTLSKFLKKQFVYEAPYNAYMWYLAPYTFTPRHAVTAVFVLGLLIGIPLSFAFTWARMLLFAALGLYALLAVVSAAMQAARYKQPAHLFTLPFAFLSYHLTHGAGVVVGLARIALGVQPVAKRDPAWTTVAAT